MERPLTLADNKSGFSFKFHRRNQILKDKITTWPSPVKTGTTSCGMIFKDGVILGSDTNSISNGSLIEKNSEKIFHLSNNIFACFAGIAADNYWVCKLVNSELKLLELETKKQCRVITAVRLIKQLLFQYQGLLEVGLIVGGVDVSGMHMITIYPHGSSDKLLYSAIGSGSMCAMSVMEVKFKQNMTCDEAKSLIIDSVSSGILNDLSSGDSIDIVTITKEGFTQSNELIEMKNEKTLDDTAIVNTVVVLSDKFQEFTLDIIEEKQLK